MALMRGIFLKKMIGRGIFTAPMRGTLHAVKSLRQCSPKISEHSWPRIDTPRARNISIGLTLHKRLQNFVVYFLTLVWFGSALIFINDDMRILKYVLKYV